MFEIGFSELLVCFLVALVVLGPEKLPKVARTVGRWTGQAKGYLRNLTAELDREAQLGELRKQLEDAKRAVQDGAQSFKESVHKEAGTLQTSVQQEVDAARDAVQATADDPAGKKP